MQSVFHYAKTLKVNAALQSVFRGTNLNGRWYAISHPPTPAFWYDRSVLRFSFACGERSYQNGIVGGRLIAYDRLFRFVPRKIDCSAAFTFRVLA